MPGDIRVEKIQNTAGRTFIESPTTGGPKIYDLKPKIIHRDGNNPILPLLPLSNPNEVHLYTVDVRAQNIYIRTSCVSDALYEVILLAGGGDTDNCDPRLYPNNTSYSGQFSNTYWHTQQGDGSWTRVNQTEPNFYFDHQNGTLGRAGFQRWVICTKVNSKYVQFEGMDYGPSLSCGYGRWVDSTTDWSWIGRIYIGPSNADIIRAYVRRLS